ncbi:MAG: DNRLRE domain-containing protein [Candidatus Cloacimonetes bacterium]|nr:DNRLRE domain-containing protein [Candidatus Cloacimonadota bacterium]
MTKQRMRGTLALIILIGLFGTMGCTKKDNLAGYNPSELKPILLVFDEAGWMTHAFTYQDTLDNHGTTGSFSVGNRDGLAAVGLLLFDNFADSVICDSAEVQLVFEDRMGDAGQTLQLARVLQQWDEYDVTWDEAQTEIPWVEPRWELLDSYDVVTTDSDTLLVTLPPDIVQSWIDGDTLNYGLALLSNDEGICQFHALGSGNQPQLSVFYTQDDTIATYTFSATADVFVCDGVVQPGELTPDHLANIMPTRLMTKWDLSLEAFNAILPSTHILPDTTELQRSTINSAELVIMVDSTASFIPEDIFTVFSYLVIDSVSVDSLPYTSDHLKSYAYTDIGAYDDGELTIDLTPIVQAVVAGFDENYGFVVSSLQEHRNMGILMLQSGMELRIVFTKPDLGE